MEALTLTQRHTPSGHGVFGVGMGAPNCAALLETGSLFYPCFTCQLLDGWNKPGGYPFCMWPCECLGWVNPQTHNSVCECASVYVCNHLHSCIYVIAVWVSLSPQLWLTAVHHGGCDSCCPWCLCSSSLHPDRQLKGRTEASSGFVRLLSEENQNKV